MNTVCESDSQSVCCGTAFRPTYDSLTLPFISSAGC